MVSHVVYETMIIAGVLAASAILIYVGLKPGLKSLDFQEVQIRRMARTLVRSVEQRAEWDVTLNSRGDKWARIVLVLQDKFDVEDDWLHIIIGEAQFDMEVDNASNSRNTKDGTAGTGRDQAPDLRRYLDDLAGSGDGGGRDSERHPGDSGDSPSGTGRASTGRTEYEDLGEDIIIPSAE